MNIQRKEWSGEFGKEYTIRNTFLIESTDKFDFDNWNNITLKEFGITQTEINNYFLNDIDIDTILEVGSNVGAQLNCFEKMKSFSRIYGLELQRYAISKSREMFPKANFDIIQGFAENIPFKDAFFDLVATNGLLIHISPDNINKVLDEIYRCSSKYIFGCEYYDDQYINIDYRGYEELLWRGNFPSMYLDRFHDLHIVKRKKFIGIVDNSHIYDVYLIKKSM